MMLKTLLTELETFIADDSEEEKKSRRDTGEFPFIPSPADRFIDRLGLIREMLRSKEYVRPHGLSFVDVGCGIGTKMLLASYIGFKPFGIEKNPKYVDIARRLLRHLEDKSQIILENALKVDYSQWDVIYYYWPILDVNKQLELEKRIVTTAKPGAFILYFGRPQPKGTEWVAGDIARVAQR